MSRDIHIEFIEDSIDRAAPGLEPGEIQPGDKQQAEEAIGSDTPGTGGAAIPGESDESDRIEGAAPDATTNQVSGDGDVSGDQAASDDSDKGEMPGRIDNIAELSKALTQAQDQIDTLVQEKSVLYDQLLRRQAEFENFRRRTERERTDSIHRTRAEVLTELLPVIDNFDRALASLENSTGDADSLRRGIELIHKQLSDALKRLGLQAIEAIGEAFDPKIHEAITLEPTEEHEENTVLEEFQRGYMLGDHLLRPAKVKVSSTPER